jgi:uncharacterized protein YbjT (DUF2867 family)
MPSSILVTGGTGRLGRPLVEKLREAGAEIRVLSRSRVGEENGVRYVTGDLATGTGVASAVEGAGTIVHCASSSRGDARGTHNLVEAAAGAGMPHLVYISIVGADRVSWGYIKSKLESERIVVESGLPWTLLRATQFFQLMEGGARSLSWLPIVPVPAGFVVQPVDPAEVAGRLAELALGQPAGRVPDFGGPEVLRFKDVIKTYGRVKGRRRPVVSLWMPGLGAVKKGALLPSHQPGTDQPQGKRTWQEYLEGDLRATAAGIEKGAGQ